MEEVRLSVEDVRIVPLEKQHLKGAFSNDGDNDPNSVKLKNWFRTIAYPTSVEKNSQTFTMMHAGKVVGFFTILVATLNLPPVQYEDGRHENNQTLLLAKLYCDQNWRGSGIGRLAVKFATSVALELDELITCRGIVTHALDTAIDFYSKMGFEVLRSEAEDNTVTMWLKLPK